MDYSEAEPLLTQHGQSLRPLIETDGETRDYAYCEWDLLPTRVGVRLSLRTVRTKTHKLTMDMESGAGELYDLVNDPDEMDNLFDDPSIAEVQKQLVEYINARPDDMGTIQVQVGGA